MLRAPRRNWSDWRTIAAARTTSPWWWCASARNPGDGFHGCAQGRGKMRPETVPQEDSKMAKLSLMFEKKLVKEVAVGSRPVGIGRGPDTDLPVANLAVSNHHARVFFEAGRLVVEDLNSLNGTFVNDLRVERATLHDGDSIWIGKHHIKVDASGDVPIAVDSARRKPAPQINETIVLDTKQRREMLQQAAATRDRSPFAGRLKMPTLLG